MMGRSRTCLSVRDKFAPCSTSFEVADLEHDVTSFQRGMIQCFNALVGTKYIFIPAACWPIFCRQGSYSLAERNFARLDLATATPAVTKSRSLKQDE
jgi:hypothetical protein